MLVHELPETRDSLLLQLQDPENRDSWFEFAAIYRPLIYRMARRRGFQDADAHDVAQSVLLSVASSIGDWETNPQRARFRTWLSRVARNAIIDALRKKRPDTGEGGTAALERLSRQPTSASQEMDVEHRREVFRWSAKRIRHEFADDTWQAFWRTTVEGQPPQQVANDLNKKVGAIYTARSRVMKRLQEKVRQADLSQSE